MSDEPWRQVLAAIAGFGERIGRLAHRLDRMEAAQVQLRADVLARIDRLQDALTAY